MRLWLFLPAIFLFAGAYHAFSHRWRRFSGEKSMVEGRAYRYRIRKNKYGIAGIDIAVALPDIARFTLRRENIGDTFGKVLGLVREWQTTDQRFDYRVYIVSDDERLQEALSADHTLRRAVGALLQNSKVDHVQMDRGMLIVSTSYSSARLPVQDNHHVTMQAARAVLAEMESISACLRARQIEVWQHARDPAHAYYLAFAFISGAIGVAGAITSMLQRAAGSTPPFALLHSHIHARATTLTIAVTAGLVLLVLLLMGRRSRSHMALAYVLLLAAPGAWLCADADAGRRNNVGPAIEKPFQSRISEKSMVRGKRGNRYYLHYAPLPHARMKARTVATWLQYFTLKVGDCVALDIRPGALGDPWLVGVKPVGCPDQSTPAP